MKSMKSQRNEIPISVCALCPDAVHYRGDAVHCGDNAIHCGVGSIYCSIVPFSIFHFC